MLATILKPLSILPLPVLHKLGTGLGWLLQFTMSKARHHASENMLQSNLFPSKTDEAVRQSFFSLGKAILETPYIWNSDGQKIRQIVKKVGGWEIVESAVKSNKGTIFLTPHMGCFEITSLFYGSHHPITVLYRAPKKKWLKPMINIGRERPNITLAEANANGVRKLMKTLKAGGAVGILPDQTPNAGEGEWADFFGKPAYTMTLASKLAQKTGATVVMVFGERLAKGEGYHVTFSKVDSIATPTLLNQAIETQIKQCPSQYYWSYHRYKVRRKSRAKQSQ